MDRNHCGIGKDVMESFCDGSSFILSNAECGLNYKSVAKDAGDDKRYKEIMGKEIELGDGIRMFRNSSDIQNGTKKQIIPYLTEGI